MSVKDTKNMLRVFHDEWRETLWQGNEQDAHQLVRQAKRRAAKIRPRAVGGGVFGRFSNIDKYRSEVAGDIISGAAIDYVGTDVCATCSGSGLNSGRNI